jgi:RsiW-degrading membrane proteinase PrsW (M82 family)
MAAPLNWRWQATWLNDRLYASRQRNLDRKRRQKVSQGSSLSPVQKPAPDGKEWLRILFIGLSLFIITTLVMFLTRNPTLYPTVILIGNFLAPVVFVTFIYDHQHLSSLSTQTIAQSFILGGVLGVLGASILEPALVAPFVQSSQGLTLGGAMAVGLVEEGCKLAAVWLLARRWRHTAEIDGLLIGAAVGMGFAALESTGYAFTAFLLSRGEIGASIAETVLRGLLAPFGHGVWTAILGAVLFRASKSSHFRLTPLVILTYLFVSTLHGLWDGLHRTLYLIIPPGIHISLVSLTLSLIGLLALVLLFRQAIHQRTDASAQGDD